MKLSVRMSDRIRHAAAKQDGRYGISAVEARPGKDGVWLSATDGHVLAIHKADGEATEPCLIPKPLLPTRKAGDVITRENGELRAASGKVATPNDGPFPPCTDILPDVRQTDRIGHVVTLNAQLLLNLAKAIGDGGKPTVTLFLPKNEKKAIAVLGGDGIGAIMPVSTRKDPEACYEEQRAEYLDAL